MLVEEHISRITSASHTYCREGVCLYQALPSGYIFSLLKLNLGLLISHG